MSGRRNSFGTTLPLQVVPFEGWKDYGERVSDKLLSKNEAHSLVPDHISFVRVQILAGYGVEWHNMPAML